jgi:hypothetical protein
MLIVTRRVGERIMIGSDVVVTVLAGEGQQSGAPGRRGAQIRRRASRGNFRAHLVRRPSKLRVH